MKIRSRRAPGSSRLPRRSHPPRRNSRSRESSSTGPRRASDPGSGGMTGETAPATTGAGGTTTGATRSSPYGRENSRNRLPPPERTRIMTTRRRQGTIARPPAAGTTTAVAGSRSVSLRNGRTTRTANREELYSRARPWAEGCRHPDFSPPLRAARFVIKILYDTPC